MGSLLCPANVLDSAGYGAFGGGPFGGLFAMPVGDLGAGGGDVETETGEGAMMHDDGRGQEGFL